MSISSVVHGIFVRQGYLWKIGANRSIPTEQDIQKVLDKMVEVLENDPDSNTIEVGRLLVQKTSEGYYSIYTQIGEISNVSS